MAANLLHDAYGSARDNQDQLESDMRSGRDRAQTQTRAAWRREQPGTARARTRI